MAVYLLTMAVFKDANILGVPVDGRLPCPKYVAVQSSLGHHGIVGRGAQEFIFSPIQPWCRLTLDSREEGELLFVGIWHLF